MHDIIIKNGTIIDGSGKSGYVSDIAIKDGKIAEISESIKADAKKIIDYLYNEYGNDIVYSLMSQYTPLPHISHIPELNKKAGSREYEILCDYAAKIGIENAYIQSPDSSDTCFIPDFYK